MFSIYCKSYTEIIFLLMMTLKTWTFQSVFSDNWTQFVCSCWLLNGLPKFEGKI